MQSKSAALQDQINELDLLIKQGATDAQLNLWEMQRKDLQDQLKVALESEKAHESRLQEAAAESSSFLGDIDIAGVPVAESGLSELAFKVLDSKVTAKHVAAISKLSLAMNEQQIQFQADLKALIERATNSEKSVNELNELNNEQGVRIYQLELENTELDTKARKGAELLFEATETIEKLNKQIEEYKKAELLAPQPAVMLSTSEQVAQQQAELKASRIPVTYMEKDPNDFTGRKWNIITVVPEESRDIHYFEKGLYRLVGAEEAEQIRADEANKKAEQEALQAAIPTLVEPDVLPVNDVTETDEAAAIQPFPESNQVDANTNGENPAGEGNGAVDEVVAEEESEMSYNDIIPFTRHHDAMIVGLEEMVKELTYRMDQHESKQAVA